MKSPHCFVSLLLCASLLLSAFSGTALATESASVFEFEYAFEDYWYDDEIPAALVGDFPVRSALLMEAESGRILFQKDENKPVPIASVTKVMVTLLIMEAIDSGRVSMDEEVTVSERAASMGGSQVYLEPGEKMSVSELLKCLVVVSANDASVALAEHIYGSEDSFILAMNERAAQLGMKNTNYVNTTGLDADGHYSSALDVALVTRELLKHPTILEYTTIWMDTIRNGAFGLANTNKLIRFYSGATGLKTGFTSGAGYCLSASAMRDGMELIAVVMGAETSQSRNAACKSLLDYGFANFAVVSPDLSDCDNRIPVRLGKDAGVSAVPEADMALLIDKAQKSGVTSEVTLEPTVTAPVSRGQRLGTLTVKSGDQVLKEVPLVAAQAVERLSYGEIYRMVLMRAAMAKTDTPEAAKIPEKM